MYYAVCTISNILMPNFPNEFKIGCQNILCNEILWWCNKQQNYFMITKFEAYVNGLWTYFAVFLEIKLKNARIFPVNNNIYYY